MIFSTPGLFDLSHITQILFPSAMREMPVIPCSFVVTEFHVILNELYSLNILTTEMFTTLLPSPRIHFLLGQDNPSSSIIELHAALCKKPTPKKFQKQLEVQSKR